MCSVGPYAFLNTDVHATDLLQCWSQYVVSMFMQQVDVHAKMCSFCTFSVCIHATGKVLKKEHEDRSIPFTVKTTAYNGSDVHFDDFSHFYPAVDSIRVLYVPS